MTSINSPASAASFCNVELSNGVREETKQEQSKTTHRPMPSSIPKCLFSDSTDKWERTDQDELCLEKTQSELVKFGK